MLKKPISSQDVRSGIRVGYLKLDELIRDYSDGLSSHQIFL